VTRRPFHQPGGHLVSAIISQPRRNHGQLDDDHAIAHAGLILTATRITSLPK
jgi:hypothetical protein